MRVAVSTAGFGTAGLPAFGAYPMKNWRQRIGTTVTFFAGVVCGGLMAGFVVTSMKPVLASIELQRQFGMKHAAYRFLTANDILGTEAALITQISADICTIGEELESGFLLPFARRRIISELQAIRSSLDYYGLDLGSVETSATGARSVARRAQAILRKYTVAGTSRSTEPTGAENGSRPTRSKMNVSGSEAGLGR